MIGLTLFANRLFSALEGPLRFGFRGGVMMREALTVPVPTPVELEAVSRLLFDSERGAREPLFELVLERKAAMSRCFRSLTRSCLLSLFSNAGSIFPPIVPSRFEAVLLAVDSLRCETAVILIPDWKGGAVLGRERDLPPVGNSGSDLLGGGLIWLLGVVLRTTCIPSTPKPLYFLAGCAVSMTTRGGEGEYESVLPCLVGEFGGSREAFSLAILED